MNVPPVSVERVQKCVVNFEIYRFLKKAANLPHPPLPQRWEPICDTDWCLTKPGNPVSTEEKVSLVRCFLGDYLLPWLFSW